jgi:hypothetical protein
VEIAAKSKKIIESTWNFRIEAIRQRRRVNGRVNRWKVSKLFTFFQPTVDDSVTCNFLLISFHFLLNRQGVEITAADFCSDLIRQLFFFALTAPSFACTSPSSL